MKRKKWYLVISALFILFGSYLFVKSNIENNAIYYAIHMPKKEGTYPEYWMVIKHYNVENLPFEMRPAFLEGGLAHYQDLSLIKSSATRGYKIFLHKNDSKFYFYDKSSKLNELDLIDENDKIITKKSFTPEEIAYAEKIRDRIFMPIMKYQKEPSINLQWLFNLIYEKEYNK